MYQKHSTPFFEFTIPNFFFLSGRIILNRSQFIVNEKFERKFLRAVFKYEIPATRVEEVGEKG